MIQGIDVSEHNGTIDWDAVKAAGIQFAVHRVGYGSNYESQDDRQAIRNMQECERLDIPYGVYLYSYALKEEEVLSEAAHALRMVKDFNPVLGVYIDMEDADGYKAKNGLVPEDNGNTLTTFCNLFMQKVAETGYVTGTYASQNYFENILLLDDSYPKWLASWGLESCPVDWAEIWQYTSDGVVPGSGSSRMDMNQYMNEARFNELTAQDVHENGQDETEPIPEGPIENSETKYRKGDHVTYNRIFSSAGDWTDGSKPYFTDGVITEVYPGSRHPYLIGDGTGFVDDNSIISKKTEYEEQSSITVGSRVRFNGSVNYNGVSITAWHNADGYIVKELEGDRAVIYHNDDIFDAVNVNECELI